MKPVAVLLGVFLLGVSEPTGIDCGELGCKVTADKIKELYALHEKLLYDNHLLREELLFQQRRCAHGINL